MERFKGTNVNNYQQFDNTSDVDIEITDTGSLDTKTLTGRRPCKPCFLQRLARPAVFAVHGGILLAIMMCGGIYHLGTITSIEKQFQLSSSEIAELSVVNDAVSLSLVIFVSYYGHTSHRPRWIATGAILVSIGLFCTSLPHFLSDPIDTESLLAGGTAQEHGAMHITETCVDESKIPPYQPSQNITGNFFSNVSDQCTDVSHKSGLGSVKWLLIAQVIGGIGSTPKFILIVSYIRDSVKAHTFTSYTAVLYIALMVGPMAGFLLASQASALYVDFDRIPADQIPNIPQDDPRWIGAWWLYYPVFSVLLFVAALPMYFYPKVMTSGTAKSGSEDEDAGKDADAVNEEETASSENGSGRIVKAVSGGVIQSFKGILLAIRRLLTNPPLMFTYLGATTEVAINTITSTFQIKYFQIQFGTSASLASTIMGGLMMPVICVGQIVSAVITRRYKFNARQCAALIIFCHVVTFMFGVVQVFVGCSEIPVAGINVPYTNSDAETSTGLPDDVSIKHTYNPDLPDLQLDSSCNSNCSCSDEMFEPVCGADGVSYISPCYAGCTDKTETNDSSLTEYYNCDCIFTNLNDSVDKVINATAVSGLCHHNCDTKTQYAVMLPLGMVVSFIASLSLNPLMFLIFSLVNSEDRSIALGVQSVVTKCLGFFPAPIIMGMLINSTCKFWQYTCGDRGSCWLYDILDYRYYFVGTTAVLKLMSLACHTAVYFTMKSEKSKTNDEMTGPTTEPTELQEQVKIN